MKPDQNDPADRKGRSCQGWRIMHEAVADCDLKVQQIEAAWALHRQITAFNPRRPWLERHFASQNGRCAYCGVPMHIEATDHTGRRATIDHVVPRARNGPDVESNTVAACLDCNQAKADLSLAEFISHPFRLGQFAEMNAPPDRLAVDVESPFRCEVSLERGVRVTFRGRERLDVVEYCVPDRWVVVPVGKTMDKRGRLMTVKLRGTVAVTFRDFMRECYAERCLMKAFGEPLIPRAA